MSTPGRNRTYLRALQEVMRDMLAAQRDAFTGIPDAATFDAQWPQRAATLTRRWDEARSRALQAATEYAAGLLADAAGISDEQMRGLLEDAPLPDLRGLLDSPSSRWADTMLSTTSEWVHRRIDEWGWPLGDALNSSSGNLLDYPLSEGWRLGRDGQAEIGTRDERYLGWRRVPEPKACDWCIMLAGRGAVYTADTVIQSWRGTAYHPRCRCRAEAVPNRDTAGQLREEASYRRKRSDSGGQGGLPGQRQPPGEHPEPPPVQPGAGGSDGGGKVPPPRGKQPDDDDPFDPEEDSDRITWRSPEWQLSRRGAIQDEPDPDGNYWRHLNEMEKQTAKYLKDKLGIHPLKSVDPTKTSSNWSAPDVTFGRRTMEFKKIGPVTNPDTIRQKVGDARKQSPNVVLDLRGYRAGPRQALDYARDAFVRYRRDLDSLLVITDTGHRWLKGENKWT